VGAEKALWKCRGGGKRGKPNPGFPLFPPPLGNLANSRRDFHIPTAQAKRDGKVENRKQVFHFPIPLRDDEYGLCVQTQTQPASGLRPARPKTRKEIRNSGQGIFRLIPHWDESLISGSLRIGIISRFQAHFWIGKCLDRERWGA